MSRETINLGRVGFVIKGDYSDAVAYKMWDMVQFQGSSYVFNHKQSVIGIPPTNTLYWNLVAEAGEKGEPGADLEVGTMAVGKYEWRYNESDESLSLFFIS